MSDTMTPLSERQLKRLAELRAQAKLSKSEQVELGELIAREHLGTPEHDPAEPAATLPQQAMPQQTLPSAPQARRDNAWLDADADQRLRELRVKPALDEGEHAEMQELSAAESEAAGHVPGEPAKALAPDHPVSLVEEVISLIQGIVDVVPATRALQPRLNRMKDHLNGMKESL